MLSISNGVVRSKGTLELSDEMDPAVHPAWMVSRCRDCPVSRCVVLLIVVLILDSPTLAYVGLY